MHNMWQRPYLKSLHQQILHGYCSYLCSWRNMEISHACEGSAEEANVSKITRNMLSFNDNFCMLVPLIWAVDVFRSSSLYVPLSALLRLPEEWTATIDILNIVHDVNDILPHAHDAHVAQDKVCECGKVLRCSTSCVWTALQFGTNAHNCVLGMARQKAQLTKRSKSCVSVKGGGIGCW